jgi:DNA polymerase-3 subunit gamma/tau
LIELPEEDLQVLRKLADRIPFDHLNHLFNLLLKGEEEVAQSTFPRTMLEMTLVRMATLRPVLAIEDILKKLEGLERTKPSSDVQTVNRERLVHEKRKEFKEARPTKEPQEQQKDESPSLKKTENSNDSQDLDNSPEEEPGEEPGGEPRKAREEAWRRLVSFTQTRNPVLGAFLAFGDLIRWSDDTIEIGFEKDSFHYERMLEAENRSQLEKICRDCFAKEAKLVISPIGQRVRSKGRVALDTAEPAQSGQEKQVEKGREGNPLIQETLRLFNGRIVEG